MLLNEAAVVVQGLADVLLDLAQALIDTLGGLDDWRVVATLDSDHGWLAQQGRDGDLGIGTEVKVLLILAGLLALQLERGGRETDLTTLLLLLWVEERTTGLLLLLLLEPLLLLDELLDRDWLDQTTVDWHGDRLDNGWLVDRGSSGGGAGSLDDRLAGWLVWHADSTEELVVLAGPLLLLLLLWATTVDPHVLVQQVDELALLNVLLSLLWLHSLLVLVDQSLNGPLASWLLWLLLLLLLLLLQVELNLVLQVTDLTDQVLQALALSLHGAGARLWEDRGGEAGDLALWLRQDGLELGELLLELLAEDNTTTAWVHTGVDLTQVGNDLIDLRGEAVWELDLELLDETDELLVDQVQTVLRTVVAAEGGGLWLLLDGHDAGGHGGLGLDEVALQIADQLAHLLVLLLVLVELLRHGDESWRELDVLLELGLQGLDLLDASLTLLHALDQVNELLELGESLAQVHVVDAGNGEGLHLDELLLDVDQLPHGGRAVLWHVNAGDQHPVEWHLLLLLLVLWLVPLVEGGPLADLLAQDLAQRLAQLNNDWAKNR